MKIRSNPASASMWTRPGVRIAASVLLGAHLMAVFVAPMAVPTSSPLVPPSTSPLAGTFFRFFRPYLQAAFLNHGYKFFAPDPGPSHLVRYELTMADGGVMTIDQTMLLDQATTKLYALIVSCSSICYERNSGDIKKVVDSWTVRAK